MRAAAVRAGRPPLPACRPELVREALRQIYLHSVRGCRLLLCLLVQQPLPAAVVPGWLCMPGCARKSDSMRLHARKYREALSLHLACCMHLVQEPLKDDVPSEAELLQLHAELGLF